jgi:hypothetical protein
MLSLDDFKEVLQLRREFNAVRDEWKRTLSDYYARKFDPDQPRVPAGSSEGGRWASGASGFRDSADVRAILERAKSLAASHAEMGRCVDLCLPLLNRFQAPGSNRNEFDFRKCLNACLGLNR